MNRTHRSAALARTIAAAAAVSLTVTLAAQSQQFQFVVAASDASGMPISDLKPDEVVMTENGAPAKILGVEPYPVPVRLTIAVDNGEGSSEAIGHYRTGLTGLVEALPPEVEVTLITTAPQPRTVVRPTTDRKQILRGITGFAPESERPRFTDALVEYSRRLEDDLKKTKVAQYLPILVMVSTTANEVSDYQVNEIEKALGFLQARKSRVYVALTVTKAGDVASVADINTNRQALIAIPTTKATNGRYEAIAVSSRLGTLLPEFGTEIAALHTKHANQFRVTVQRPDGVSGQLQNPEVRLTRPGITGAVSVDGL